MEGLQDLKELFQKKLEKIEVIPAQTLFDPDWSMLNQSRCPLCTNKLKLSRRNVWICKGKKHAKPYIITKKRMDELTANQEKKRAYLENKEKYENHNSQRKYIPTPRTSG